MAKLNKEKLLLRVKKFYDRGEYEKCLKTLNKILRNYPNDLDIYDIKLDLLLNYFDEHEEYVQTVKQFVENSPKEINHYLTAYGHFIAIADENEEIHEEIVSLSDEAFKVDPYNGLIALMMAKSLLFMGKRKEAFEFIDEFKLNSPDWKTLLNLKCDEHFKYGEYEEYLDVLNEILTYDNEDVTTLTIKLKTLKSLGRIDEIEEIIDDKLNNDNDTKLWALTTKGLYTIEEDREKAMEYIQEALKIEPDNLYTLYAKGKILYEIGEYDDTIETFEPIIHNLISLHNKYGDSDDRIEDLIDDVKAINGYNFVITFVTDLFIIMAKVHHKNEEIIEAVETLNNINDTRRYYGYDEAMKLKEKYLAEIRELYPDEEICPDCGLPMSVHDEDNYEFGLDKIDFFDDDVIDEENPLETLEDYEHSIKHFENVKGEKYFQEYAGHFWLIPATRPYMEQLLDYSLLLWDAGRKEEKIEKLELMIQLNPGDNQGVRDLLTHDY